MSQVVSIRSRFKYTDDQFARQFAKMAKTLRRPKLEAFELAGKHSLLMLHTNEVKVSSIPLLFAIYADTQTTRSRVAFHCFLERRTSHVRVMIEINSTTHDRVYSPERALTGVLAELVRFSKTLDKHQEAV